MNWKECHDSELHRRNSLPPHTFAGGAYFAIEDYNYRRTLHICGHLSQSIFSFDNVKATIFAILLKLENLQRREKAKNVVQTNSYLQIPHVLT